MESRFDWLSVQIERLLADKSVRPGISGVEYEPDSGDLALLRLAANFNGLRPGSSTPDPAFVSDLGSRLGKICAGRAGHRNIDRR